MPRTIIKLKTFMCPLGVGNVDGECRFHRSVDNLPESKICPMHGLKLQKTTTDEDRVTVTIIGEEELETLEIDDKKVKRKLTAEEKIERKNKIKADIQKFKVFEDI